MVVVVVVVLVVAVMVVLVVVVVVVVVVAVVVVVLLLPVVLMVPLTAYNDSSLSRVVLSRTFTNENGRLDETRVSRRIFVFPRELC